MDRKHLAAKMYPVPFILKKALNYFPADPFSRRLTKEPTMKRLILMLCLLSIIPAYAQDTPDEKLMVFAPFIGTWKAEFADGTHDVSNYEWILGGKALRIMHSISDGDYGGEALVHWNTEKEVIIYRYVTTASFYTEGKITPTENGFDAHEIVHGNMGGITKTRSGYTLKEGEIHVWSQFLKDGEWAEKTQTTYIKAPDATVRF
jgi:hypothetical protein